MYRKQKHADWKTWDRNGTEGTVPGIIPIVLGHGLTLEASGLRSVAYYCFIKWWHMILIVGGVIRAVQ